MYDTVGNDSVSDYKRVLRPQGRRGSPGSRVGRYVRTCCPGAVEVEEGDKKVGLMG